MDNVKDQVRDVGQGLADAFTFKKQRQQVSDAVDGAVKKAKSLAGSIMPSTPPTTYKYDDKALAGGANPNSSKAAPKAAPAKSTAKMPSYKEGTLNVPKTGPAKLHKGEAVLPKEHAEHLRSAVAGALGHGEEKPKKEIRHIITRKAKNGGYVHEHHHTAPEHHPMEEHISPDQDSMVEHMMDHMGEANPGEAEADAGQSGVPMQQGAM